MKARVLFVMSGGRQAAAHRLLYGKRGAEIKTKRMLFLRLYDKLGNVLEEA